MAYNAIRPAAYMLDPGTAPFIGLYRALAFPRDWRQPILDLCQHGRRNPDNYRQVPISRLNAAFRAVAPDLVSVAEWAALDDSKPWLYTDSEYPVSVVGTLILSWLKTMQPSMEAFPQLREAYGKLDVKSLSWDLVSVDLAEQTLTVGGTADPETHLYRLLPDVLAARIEQLPPYEYGGAEVTFRRAATEQGAELISWPPSEYRPRAKKGEDGRPWHFSAVIKITMQTVPFSPAPRIHLTTGIRRWVRGRLFKPPGRSVTTYLLSDGPWLAGTEQTPTFAAAKIGWSGKEGKLAWAVDGPGSILSQVRVRDFPAPESLGEEAEAWIGGQVGVAAAVTHHTMMGYHGVKVGLMPSERQRLTQWAATALQPQFRPVGDLARTERKTTPDHTLKKPPSIPKPKADPYKNPDPAEVAKIIERRAAVKADNARLRRERLALALDADQTLTCYVLFQTDAVRDELITAAERHLGLHPYRVSGTSPRVSIWRTPEMELRIHAVPLGALGGPLATEAGEPRRGRGHDHAVEDRRSAVCEFLKALPDPSQVVFVELEGKQAFRSRTDPKGAIRLGCADAGQVSQFITPETEGASKPSVEDAVADDKEGKLEHRAAAAWADGLRQTGMTFVPKHSLGDAAIPDRLNQLAFWIVRRNTGEASRSAQFTPVAVLIRPDQACVMGRTPGTPGWVPYPDLLKGLTGQVRGADLKSAEQQKTATAHFIRQVLYGLRGEPTVVLAYAQNMRRSWEWLSNNRLVADKIQLGNGPVQAIELYGKQLRLIRVRDDDRNETPQWWAPDGDEIAGIATGLWRDPRAGDDNRLFYATTGKASTAQDAMRDDTKLTPHLNVKSGKPVTNWTRNAWNPTLLEIAVIGHLADDDPEAWATYVHQQRIVDDYRDALKFPLVLHLAELAHEYALPFGDEAPAHAGDEGDDVEPDDSPTPGDEATPE